MLAVNGKYTRCCTCLLLALGLLTGGCMVSPVAFFEVNSDPQGATITLDGKYLGKSPLRAQEPAASASHVYVIKAELPGYKMMEARYHNAPPWPAIKNPYFRFVNIPSFPDPPAAIYPDAKSVAVSPLDLSANRNERLDVSKDKNIAIMKFKEPQGSGAGSLIADSLILNLQIKGYNVIEREQIEKLIREQGLVAEGKTNLTDLEMSRQIGKLLSADYFVYGAITEYAAKSENISLSPQISQDELARYLAEYKEYINAYEEMGEEPSRVPLTLQEWEMKYASNPKSSYINIARVGVTAKIVDIRTSKIVWVGIANVSDLSLHVGMKRVADAMIKNITDIKP